MAKFTVMYQSEGREGMTLEQVQAHVDHLKDLHSKGILFLCGLLKDEQNDKALLILETGSMEEAEQYVAKDPLIILKYYQYTITELIEANPANNFLLVE